MPKKTTTHVRGRPPFVIYLRADEKVLLARAAEQAGDTSLGSYIRRIALTAARLELGLTHDGTAVDGTVKGR